MTSRGFAIFQRFSVSLAMVVFLEIFFAVGYCSLSDSLFTVRIIDIIIAH